MYTTVPSFVNTKDIYFSGFYKLLEKTVLLAFFFSMMICLKETFQTV